MLSVDSKSSSATVQQCSVISGRIDVTRWWRVCCSLPKSTKDWSLRLQPSPSFVCCWSLRSRSYWLVGVRSRTPGPGKF